jgi:hypothetical protein
VLACAADVRAGTLACRPALPGSTGVSAALLGAQNENVRLASSNVSYDGVDVFQADVTVQNLSAQVLGTHDDEGVAAEGVRVFFHAGPTVTAGTGMVTVANADGADTFTGAGQPYFQYAQMLATTLVSAPRNWRFSVPATVSSFSFVVFVAAPVREEGGWVQLTPPAPSLPVGAAQQLTPTVRSFTGSVLGGAVAWSTSDAGVATVDGSGVVTGVAAGTAVITATSGARTGAVAVVVRAGAGDVTPPTITGFALSAPFVQANGSSVTFSIHVADAGVGSDFAGAQLRSPSGGVNRACTQTIFTGGVATGTFQCAITFNGGDEAGLWEMVEVVAEDAGFRRRTITKAGLRAAGYPAVLQVVP